ncbi:MAG TPA: M23 family metallopeptidase, partial [Vicinamibacterales bacterium]|nr:M23 family metallopeptidase [Vicinamibacterales bacterium]
PEMAWPFAKFKAGTAVILTAGLVIACGGSSGTPTTPTDPGPGSGPFAFRASPIDVALIHSIAPLGTVSAPSRWLPTDHLYFRFAEPSQSPVALRTSFFAPADGTVRDVFSGAGSDVGVDINVTATMTYRIGHLIPSVSLARGTRVTAGQRLGTTGSSFDIDLSLFNDALTLFFVNPARAGNQVHTAAPLRYFEEPLRSQLYAKVQRFPPDLDGRVDFDVAGRLSGNWFTADSIPLVFAYDSWDPAQVVISVGGALMRTGIYTIAVGDPAPRDVSVSSGLVRYTLFAGPGRPGAPPPGTGLPGAAVARLLVEMLGPERIRVEMFSPSASADAFTTDAKTFDR